MNKLLPVEAIMHRDRESRSNNFRVSPVASPAAGTTGTGVLKPSKAPMRAPVPGTSFARTGN